MATISLSPLPHITHYCHSCKTIDASWTTDAPVCDHCLQTQAQ